MINELLIDLLQKGHAVQFQARGDSMDPLIRDHDYLHVEPCESFRVGDVVLVLAERGLTAHRVVSLRDGVVVTQGDNAPAADDAVPREKVLGKVTAVIREGRKRKLFRSAAALAAALVRLRRRIRKRWLAPPHS